MSIHQLSVHITPLARFVRITVGVVGVVAAALLLRDAGSGWEAALGGLLALAGLDLIVTVQRATARCTRTWARPSLAERTHVMTTMRAPDDPHSQLHQHPTAPSPAAHVGREPAQHQGHRTGHGLGHELMMLACCVPMLLIASALVVSGAAGAGAIFYALACTAMMAAMIFGMPGHRH